MSNSNSSWFSWWFLAAQPAATESSGVTDSMTSRVYIDELKQKLKEQLRAERAECRLDFSNPHHNKLYQEHISRVSDLIMCSSIDMIRFRHKCASTDQLSSSDLLKILRIREERRVGDLKQQIEMQKN